MFPVFIFMVSACLLTSGDWAPRHAEPDYSRETYGECIAGSQTYSEAIEVCKDSHVETHDKSFKRCMDAYQSRGDGINWNFDDEEDLIAMTERCFE